MGMAAAAAAVVSAETKSAREEMRNALVRSMLAILRL